MPVEHALMKFKTKMKLALIAEGPVVLVQLAMIKFKTKRKLALIAVDHVLHAVRKQYSHDINRHLLKLNLST